jgi:hypothetical protein
LAPLTSKSLTRSKRFAFIAASSNFVCKKTSYNIIQYRGTEEVQGLIAQLSLCSTSC